MILRRVIKHVRGQEWTAIFIDFFIVVFGVFVGLQVSNWNSVRNTKLEETRLVAQLAVNVDAAIISKKNWIHSTDKRVNALASAIDFIQNASEQTVLSEEHCGALWTSHIIIWQPSKLMTFEEILLTGGLGTLSNHKLREALMTFQSEQNSILGFVSYISQDFANVVDNYPDVFTREFNLAEDTNVVICDLEAIRANRAFQNKMLSNLGRTKGLVGHANVELGLLENVKEKLGAIQ